MESYKVLSCREAFRQHAMDLPLPEACAPHQPHWMLRDESLRDWIAELQQEYLRLRLAGGEPLNGEPIGPEAVIRWLGFTHREEPRGFLGYLAFTVSMVLATTREAAGVRCELLRLHRQARGTMGVRS